VILEYHGLLALDAAGAAGAAVEVGPGATGVVSGFGAAIGAVAAEEGVAVGVVLGAAIGADAAEEGAAAGVMLGAATGAVAVEGGVGAGVVLVVLTGAVVPGLLI
jgi:hypothetical protein